MLPNARTLAPLLLALVVAAAGAAPQRQRAGFVDYPDVRGLSPDEAERMMIEAGADEVIFLPTPSEYEQADDSPRDVEINCIAGQFPAAGYAPADGKKSVYLIGSGAAPASSLNQLVGMTVEDAMNFLGPSCRSVVIVDQPKNCPQDSAPAAGTFHVPTAAEMQATITQQCPEDLALVGTGATVGVVIKGAPPGPDLGLGLVATGIAIGVLLTLLLLLLNNVLRAAPTKG